MRQVVSVLAAFVLSVLCLGERGFALDLARLAPSGKGLSSTVMDGKATLQSDAWGFLTTPEDAADVELAATFTIVKPAKRLGFFGESWSVWPDATYGDGGYEAGILLRGGAEADSGYRVQWSHKYQSLALVKFPSGGYLRVVPCEVPLNKPVAVKVSVQGNRLTVSVEGKDKLRYDDTLSPLEKGRVGLGVSSQAKVTWEAATLRPLPAAANATPPEKHQPNFRVQRWLGDRPWVFDGDEPILLLPVPEATSINNVKLRPGYKPQLSWNSHWDIQNQGAFPEGDNKVSAATTRGGGESLVAEWTCRQVKDKFVVRTQLTIGYDASRPCYTYDVESELEVTGKEPFHFRYGYDFEHHTPLDPFRWQYLVVKRNAEQLVHRPVYPVDPGQINDLEGYRGLRLWHGRHNDPAPTVPAVEYLIDPAWNVRTDAAGKPQPRKLNTAVCAAFYDTGIGYEPETASPGEKVRVKYRYVGYEAQQAETMFNASKIFESPMLDPEHHYLFAGWPKQTFSQFVPMSKTWIYGRTPFMTAHNARPTYELQKETGFGSGYAMKLGPASFGAAVLPAPEPLAKGTYVLLARCRSENTHGPGGRIELNVLDAKSQKPLAAFQHYIGNGSFGWKPTGFAFQIPQDGAALSLGFGNAGTGDAYFAEVEIKQQPSGAALPQGVSETPQSKAPSSALSPQGAVADYRFVEQKGLHALDFAGGPLGLLELANVDWVTDEGHPAIRFADKTSGKRRYPRWGTLERGYFNHPAYAERQQLPVAVAGFHGAGQEWQAFSIATWIKPAAAMGKSDHSGGGDIVGLGARRFILSLEGQQAPYRLQARLNVSDRITASEPTLAADRWYHVAMTCEPTADKKRLVRLFVDGKPVHEAKTEKLESPTSMPSSLILGAELFYMHDAYYRGLIGRTMLLDHALSPAELAELMKLGS